jgi:salicylate hydroxylase
LQGFAQVTVLEQADAIREVGAGLQISPNAAAVLQALGLGAALDAASGRAEAVRAARRAGPASRDCGMDLMRLRPGAGLSFPAPGRPDRASADGARAGGCRSAAVAAYRNGRSVRRAAACGDGAGAEIMTGLLVGADGLHSTRGRR